MEPEMTEMKWKDAIKVIKTAKKLGVTKLKFGTLEFEIENGEPCAPRNASKIPKKKIAEAEAQNAAQLAFDEAKLDLSVMHVEDPAGFEQALIEKELDDDPSAGEQLEEKAYVS
jgi:hypothetical protein